MRLTLGLAQASGTASNSVNASPKQGASLKKLTEFGWYPSCIGFLGSCLLAASFDCSAVCHVGSWQQSEHTNRALEYPLSGVKRTSYFKGGRSCLLTHLRHQAE